MNKQLQIFFMILLSLLSVGMVVFTFTRYSNQDKFASLPLSIEKSYMRNVKESSTIVAPVHDVKLLQANVYEDESMGDETKLKKVTGDLSVPDGLVYLLFLLIAYLAVKMSSSGITKKHHS